MDYTLKDLLDIPRLRALLDSFDELHSMPSAIIDTEGVVLTATAWQDICTKFHRVHPETSRKCIESDRHIEARLDEHAQHVVFRCPMGLVDAATPIVIEGKHLGNVFTGQLFMDDPDESFFIRQAREYGFDEQDYLDAMRQVPFFAEEKLHKNLNFIHKLTQMLAEQGLQHKRQCEAEEALRESENTFRSLFEDINNPISLIKDGRFIDCNAALLKQLGYASKAEFLNRTPSDISPPTQPDGRKSDEKAVEMIATALESGYHNFEWVHSRADGTPLTVEVSLTPISVGGKKLLHTLWRDISAHKQRDSKLRQEQLLSQTIMDSLPGIFYLYSYPELRLLRWNRQHETLLGYNPGEIAGFHVTDWHLPEVKEAVIAAIETVMEQGQSSMEAPLMTKQGEPVYFYLTGVRLEDQGKLYLLGTGIDITDLKRTENQLSYSMSLTNAALESTADGILIVGRDGRIARWNQKFVDLWQVPQHLLDTTVKDPVLAYVTSLMAQPETFLARVIELNEHPEESSFDTLYLVDGRIIERYSQPQRMGDEIIGRFWSFRDITERKLAEEERISLEKQLLHAQKLESLGVLAGGIAHDFNNILMAIIGNADLALMRLNKESPAIENLHRIEQAATRAADLAKQMLAYSGKGKFVVETIDLNLLLEEMLHMLEVSISKKAVLRINQHKPLPFVEADATQLRQIVMNLVINASEAIGDRSGVIAITTGSMECDRDYLKNIWLDEKLCEGQYAFVEIADTGCGMDKETLSKLFDPFFTTKFTGRGLGMAAVLGIVRGHKGAIKVYSEPDRGTTFKILLPVSDRKAESCATASQADNWRGSGVVMLVDDEKTVRGVCSEMLRELGFTPITANDGREALEMFGARGDIRAVILDLTMPHMDGEQCFRELRKLRPDVKVIMSSGFNEQEVTEKFMGKGLAGFIQKPYRISVLRDALKSL